MDNRPSKSSTNGRPDAADRNSTSLANNSPSVPVIELPKGGGAIRGIEEKFQVNSLNGTATLSIPIPLSPSRGGSAPSIGLSYNSGAGNSPFGIGWNVDVPSIKRKTENQLPQYKDAEESDTFILSGTEDLVPLLEEQGGNWLPSVKQRDEDGKNYTVTRYRPRIEGAFSRIEKWQDHLSGDVHWRVISRSNVHSYYGLTAESRITNPNDLTQVFEWLLCRAHDDKGNLAIYRYKGEDFSNVPDILSESNRKLNCTQTYIKEVWYGNKHPYFRGDQLPDEDGFIFKALFDYGEHDSASPIPKDVYLQKSLWKCRLDPFSSYRSGFEIRTYRRCQRVMVFHCCDATDLPHSPYLVKSLELTYQDELDLRGVKKKVEGFSYLVQARQCGHKWDAEANHYTTKHLPDFVLKYQVHEWDFSVKQVLPEDIVHAPVGIDDKQYLWVDLFSEGIAGILTEQTGGWYYKSNLGNGRFGHAIPVAPKPSFGNSATTAVIVQELEGNGIKYLVHQGSEPKGFFKLGYEQQWEPFKPFSSFPNLDLQGPNLRLLDLNGDGRADLLMTEEDCLRWYPSAGEAGFQVSRRITKEIDEEKGPAMLFADQTQSIFLADMNGDGLTDIVRIQNGETCYWPNLGYGRFGAKVAMDDAPVFDHPDMFNPSFLRLADIDGSGTIDLIYLGTNEFKVWMNLSGNGWTKAPVVLPAFPNIDNLVDVAVLDFLGTGTASIVYSSPLLSQAQYPIQYIDLMGSKKPHVLIGHHNNCGSETSIEYRPSTSFYLEDKNAGRKWITTLPFPVHCVAKVKVEDKIRDMVFSNSYRYSHGYFDYHEREFRGFARVEQLDTEEFSQFKLNAAKNVVTEELHQPPVKTISWFHTGAFIESNPLLHQCKSEYFTTNQFAEFDLPDPVIAGNLTAQELREALRACKGLPLRSEVYAADNSPLSTQPYSAIQSTFEIRLVQPKREGQYASFLVLPFESLSYGYERNPADPRISHAMILEADRFGNVTKSASIVYSRVKRPVAPNDIPDKVWAEQNKSHITYGETIFTDDIDKDETYRLRVAYETKSYEIAGFAVTNGNYVTKAALFAALQGSSAIPFENEFSGGLQKRLSAHSRTYFLKDDLSDALALGKLSSLGLPHKSYQLAFTKPLVTKYYGVKVTSLMLTDAKYVHSEGDEDWWVQTGTAVYDANPKTNFYAPIAARDVFGNESRVEYDKYVLLVRSSTDAIGNKVTSQIDYRTLAPAMVIDINNNRASVETDELGLVIKSAVMGKDGAGEGDTLADPTARMEYDLFNWQKNQKPNYVHTFVREQHGAGNPRWQESYGYSDGGGSIIMTKSQAEPGKAKRWNVATKQVEDVEANPRWVGNGRTILNNKGNPVKQYEPYFSTTHEYEHEDALVEMGITPILYYDPVGRNIKTDYPNGTFAKVEFDAWSLKSFDLNDTVKASQWYADRGSPDPSAIPEPTDVEQRAAWLAAKHDRTPETVHTDSIGRTFYTTADYGNGKTVSVYSETDLVGRYAKVFDQLGRNVSEAYTNLVGAAIYGKSAEKGERWTFTDVMGRLVRVWDNNIREFYSTFDQLHRPVGAYVKEGDTETLFTHVVYGELLPDAPLRNMRGRAYQLYDQAGRVTMKTVDFKGNVLEVERRLMKSYDRFVDWKVLEGQTSIAAVEAAAAPLIELENFASSLQVDALNRPTLVTLFDSSVMQPMYNEANLLNSLRVKIRGAGSFITFLENQDYDAKGQRQFARYGNGLITNYTYDQKTFRLTDLVTKKAGASDAQSLQRLNYTFDPVGNIVALRDEAQPTHYFANEVVRADAQYEYDALYQLLKATGREHAGLGGNSQRDDNDCPYIAQLPHQNDLNAVRRYTELYQYNDCGNILQLRHVANNANWTQRYRYEYQDDPSNKTNRLKSTSLPADPNGGPYSATYQHDQHGNMVKMPHLNELVWNVLDQLAKVDLGGGGLLFCVYGLGGRRVRKIVQRFGSKRTERIYLGPVEIYREYQNNVKKLERSTLHVADNAGRIAQIDTKLIDEDGSDTANPLNTNLIRYQYVNHLGSGTLETDEFGVVILYEEYHPYGTSAYRSTKSDVDLSLKRYRFSGKERDEETGLYYFGARYYAGWLGRWTSSDPAGLGSGPNLFRYCSNNPIVRLDPNGMQDKDFDLCDLSILAKGQDGKTTLFPHPGCVPRASSPTAAHKKQPAPARPHVKKEITQPPTRSPLPEQHQPPPESPPLEPPSATKVESDTALSSSTRDEKSDGSIGAGPVIQAGPALEKFIWNYRFSADGVRGSTRGFWLQNFYTNNPRFWQRDNVPNIDNHIPGEAQQIKSTDSTKSRYVGQLVRNATRAADDAISAGQAGTAAGDRPRAVVITPTDAPASVANDIDNGLAAARKPYQNTPLQPEHVRGLPGALGTALKGLTFLGTGVSAFSLGMNLGSGDYAMASGDALTTAGGALESYAILTAGAKIVAGASAMTVGLAVGGVGIAVTSGISMSRAADRGDARGAVAGFIGTAAGLSMAAGATGLILGAAAAPVLFAAAPVLIAAGAVAALGVGVFHIGRHFGWWD